MYIQKRDSKSQKTVDTQGFFAVLEGQKQNRQVLQVIQVIQ